MCPHATHLQPQAALKALGQRQMLKEEQGLLAHAVKAAGGASGSGSGPGRPGGARAEMEEAQRLQVGFSTGHGWDQCAGWMGMVQTWADMGMQTWAWCMVQTW